jgi:hypothetical protein
MRLLLMPIVSVVTQSFSSQSLKKNFAVLVQSEPLVRAVICVIYFDYNSKCMARVS